MVFNDKPSTGIDAFAGKVHCSPYLILWPWPWPLTFSPQNLITSSVCHGALKL